MDAMRLADKLVSVIRDTDPTLRNASNVKAKAEKTFKDKLRSNAYPDALIEKLVYDCYEVAKHERALRANHPEIFDTCNS